MNPNNTNPRFQFAGQHVLNTPQSPAEIDRGWARGGAVDPSQLTPEQLQDLLPNIQTNALVSSAMSPDRIGPGYWNRQAAGVADAMAAQNNPMDPFLQEQMAAQALTSEPKPKQFSIREVLADLLMGE